MLNPSDVSFDIILYVLYYEFKNVNICVHLNSEKLHH